MKKAIVLFIVLGVLTLFLTGCTRTAEEGTLYTSGTLEIVREGTKTRILDLAGKSEYSFTSKRERAKTGEKSVTNGIVTADTDTIRIETAHGIIIVTDKTAGSTVYVK